MQCSLEVAARIGRLVGWARRYAPAEISSTSITTLDTLCTEGPLRLSTLAARERVSQPGMTALVNRLAAAGHAERIADPSDGRAALVRITASGRTVLRTQITARASGLQGAIAALPPADHDALVAALPAIDRLITSQPTTSDNPTR